MNNKILYTVIIGLIALTSCRREERISVDNLLPDQLGNICVSFNNTDTKCSDSNDEAYLGETMIVTEDGDTLYISAYLSDMEKPEQKVDTKSTLINGSGTTNYNTFGKADGYTSFLLDVYKEGENTIYKSYNKKVGTDMKGAEVLYNNSTSKWTFNGTYFWPADYKALNFCSYGPSSEFGTDGSVSDMTWNNSTHTFSFKYTTPAANADTLDAELQKDIIVGVNQQSYVKGGANNININLTHPLMAVRFVLGDIFGKIEYIALKNFLSEGTVSVKSSGGTPSCTWDISDTKATFWQTFKMFDATKYTDAQKAAGTVELDQTDKKTRNFIIIPQQIPSDAAIEIKMGNNLHPEILLFDKIVEAGLSRDWRSFSGKIVTFRISSQKANLVSVDITDEVNQSTMTKQNIKIVNDGKSPIYIRAVLVGNWLNVNDNVLAPWSESDPYGTFTPASFPTTLPSNWTLNPDGFYYYKKIIKSGHQVSQNLFDTFTLTSKPTVTSSTSDPLLTVTSFELDILVQAVSADTTKSELSNVAKMARTAWNISDSDLTKYFSKEQE